MNTYKDIVETIPDSEISVVFAARILSNGAGTANVSADEGQELGVVLNAITKWEVQ